MKSPFLRSGILLVCVLLAACGQGSEQQGRLDVAFESARSQARARLVAKEAGVDPAAIPFKPAMIEQGHPIIANEQPRPWVVLMLDGPGPDAMTIEAYAGSAAMPVRSEVVRRPAAR